MSHQPVYEIVIFQSNKGITSDQVIEAAQSIQPFLKNFNGYIDRQLTHAGENQWIDIVRWESLDDAHHAAEEIMKQPEAGQFMSIIDPDSIQMLHSTIAFQASKSQNG